MTKLGAPDTRIVLIFLPGVVSLKARTTVIVFAKTVDIATDKDSKCGLLQGAGDYVGMPNEEQGTEGMESGDNQQDVAENAVIGLHNGSVTVPYKRTRNRIREGRGAQDHAGQCHPQWLFISQKGGMSSQAVCVLCARILVMWTPHTLLHICS